MPSKEWTKVTELAQEQFGYIIPENLIDVGVDKTRLRQWSKRGHIEKVDHGVYRFPSIPSSSLGPYMLATLWAKGRGIISHDSALELHDLCDVNPDRTHISVPPKYWPRKGGKERYVVHHEELKDSETTLHEGIPVVTAAKAIEQGLKSKVPHALMREAIRNARARGKLSSVEIENLILVGRLA